MLGQVPVQADEDSHDPEPFSRKAKSTILELQSIRNCGLCPKTKGIWAFGGPGMCYNTIQFTRAPTSDYKTIIFVGPCFEALYRNDEEPT